jgi:hypothetical protein
MRRYLFSLLLFTLSLTTKAQPVAPLWQNFVDARQTGGTPTLPDFSYAGYHFSEKAIPDVSGRKFFRVTDYGAKPNDNDYDDQGIQAAIQAAEGNPGGGVVFFPAGKYLISPDEDKSKFIRISKSNIVLKGSGSGPGGTEIFQDKKRIGTRQFQFKPESTASTKLTTITKEVSRESFWVEVASPAGLTLGQDVVIRHRSEAFTRLYFASLPLDTDWTRLFGPEGGMNIYEIHTIEKVEGDSSSGYRVKFENPLHFDLKLVSDATFDLYTYPSLEECGVEDLLFTSNWKSYPEEFVHHQDAIHDSGWDAIGMENLKNSWIRNCEFRDINECIFMRSGYKVTVTNTAFKGKKGHSSVHARTGYGVLVKNCQFNGSHHHGPGTGYSASNTVVTQCRLGVDQNIDSHSGQPFATLFDDVLGGVFTNLGGPLPGLPHHGNYLVMWNFRHRSTKDFHYNFWDTLKRRNHTIAHPIFVGFQPDRHVTFENEGLNQLPGVMAKPRSLFEAQLNLRLKNQAATGANAGSSSGKKKVK